MKNRSSIPNYLLPVLVFFAGFSFLVYEVSWVRMLALAIGATVKSGTLVLMAFMAGAGTGAWIWGGMAGKKVPHQKILTILFLLTGLTALAASLLIQSGIPALYGKLASAGFTVSSADGVVVPLSLLLMFVPAFFMGGVLPVITGMIACSGQNPGKTIGKVYALETIGSTIGGLATGFLLIRLTGQQNTLLLAIFLNLISALLLWIFRFQSESPIREEKADITSAAKSSKEKNARDISAGSKTAALTGTFMFGFAMMGLQVVWFRIFRIYMTNTSYTFSLIASVVILGVFAGSRFYASGRAKKAESDIMAVLLLITAGVVVTGGGILLKIPELIMFPLAGDKDAYFMRIIVIPAISALLVIFSATFLSGYGFPLACALVTGDNSGISRGMGRILFYNTLGSVAGPFLAAFVLIPLLGAGRSVFFFAFSLMGAAWLITRKSAPAKAGGLKYIAIAGSSALLIFLIAAPELKILPPSFTRFNREIMEYRESVEGTWVVGREPGGKGAALATYVNNSAVIGSSYDAIKVVKMVGHLPFYAGLECKNVLVVGFGIGVTTSAIASHPEVESIDCIELVAGLKDAAHYYGGLNNNVQNDRRLKVFPGDGRHYLQASGKKYDLISSDPTHPVLGSGSLYTKEYFELCKSRLNEGGMVSQYLPLHKLLPADFQGIIKTFHSVFPQSAVWLGHNHAVLLGVNGRLSVDFGQWSERIADSPADPYFYNNPYHLAACLVLDDASVSQFPESLRLNTDNFPATEFFKMASFDNENIVENLNFLNRNRCRPGGIFTGIPDSAMMQRFIEGNRLLTEGIALDLNGNRRGLLNKLSEAAGANPENEEYPFLIKFYGR